MSKVCETFQINTELITYYVIENMKKFGLIGFPLVHSFSYKYFTEKFEKEQLNGYKYFNFPIPDIDEFPSIIEQNPNLYGLSVTSPYKRQVIRFLDQTDQAAKEIHAVNCIKIERNGSKKPLLIGYNTDIYGFTKSLKPFLTDLIKQALIIGTGGAADAVKYSLEKMNITCKFVSASKTGENIYSYNRLNKNIIEDNLLIINATPVGMFPNIQNFPEIPYNFLTGKHICFDLIYNPEQTVFLQKAKEKGAIIINGMEMLIFQAEKAWEIFNE